MDARTDAQRDRLLWLATFLLATLPLLGWWLYGLFDLDEGFYAAVTGEMLRTGDWITPHFNGKPWFEKPILLYWTAAPFVAMLGEDWGPRVPSVLANLGLYVMVGHFVSQRISPAAGRWAMLILGTSPLVALLGRMMMTDALFVLFLSSSLLSLYRSFSTGWNWRAVSGFSLGMAVLAKGPVGIILWLLVAALVAWRQPALRKPLLELKANAAGLATLLATIAVWYLPAYLADRDVFVQKFLIEQNLQRFLGGDKAHSLDVSLIAQLPIFPLVLAIGMIPWSWRILEGWPRKAEIDAPGSTFLQFCAHWLIVILVFFSISGSKLPHYILPATVPLAILCASAMKSQFFGFGTLAWGIVLSVGLNAAGILYYQTSGQAEAHRLARWIKAQGGTVAAYQLPRRQKARGTGGTRLQQTSLPSMAFYLDRNYVQAEERSDLIAHAPLWVFTREGRISGLDQVHMSQQGFRFDLVRLPFATEHFTVYRLERRGLPRR